MDSRLGIRIMATLAAVALISTFSMSSYAQAPLCRELFATPQVAPGDAVFDDLYLQRSHDTKGLSQSEVRRSNEAAVARLLAYHPGSIASRKTGSEISYANLQRALEVLKSNEVVGSAAKTKYAREDREIGYCFGRALFLHLLLRKMGLQENSIQKLWIVGPQKSEIENVTWGFHVATAAYVKGYGWMAIDTNTFRIQPIEHWYRAFSQQSTDGKPRFYVTPATRFSVSIPRYSRVQLGLDLPVAEDFYRHYFVDTMKWMSQAQLAELGLSKVAPSSETQAPRDTRKKSKFGSLWNFLGI